MSEVKEETMEQRLAEIGTRIDHLVEAVRDAEFGSALKGELQVWHEWLDEARVQVALGTMEARKRLSERTKAVERMYSRMRKRAEELEDASDPVPGLTDAVRQELGGIKKEFSSPDIFVSLMQ